MPLTRADLLRLIKALEEEGTPVNKIAAKARVSPEQLQSWLEEDSPPEKLERALISICEKDSRFRLLHSYGLATPTFNRYSRFSFDDNPIGYNWHAPLPPLPEMPQKLLDFKVDFPFGVPACILTYGHRAIKMYAGLGFDILTYKTVRTLPHKGHPWTSINPNWAYVTQLPSKFSPPFEEPVVADKEAWPESIENVTMVNSFGIPSMNPDQWKDDIEKAKKAVRRGHQVLIVSVVASPDLSTTMTQDEIVQGFVNAGKAAKEAGADIVEVNYSCPNTPKGPEIYRDPVMSARISEAMHEALKPTPVLMKIGYLRKEQLSDIVSANIKWIDGIVAINTISAPVNDSKGNQFFPGEGRQHAGVSGVAIKPWAMEVARNLADLRSQESWREKIILAVGGVTKPEDVREYLDIGVDGVLSCTGAYNNRYLAIETRRQLGKLAPTASR